MNFKKQIEVIKEYFGKAETKKEKFSLGVELEYLILDDTALTAIPYYGKNGINEILNDLQTFNWIPEYENNNLLKLEKNKNTITLEPGGQLELSISPQKEIKKIEEIYFSFLNDIIPILEGRNMSLTAIGYQPVSSIEDIPLLPKKRYDYMFDYFKTKGKYAHNMMKGTASVQVSVDYSDEKDYIKKNKVANYLSSIIYTIFDNAPIFEGEVANNFSTRAIIWDNCDQSRCGFIDNVFNKEIGYEDYAKYVLNKEPIIIEKDGTLVYTKNEKLKNLFNPDNYRIHELEHVLSMVFPDVRTKSFLEIRSGDSIPYPYNFGFIALWKGLLYNEQTLNLLYNQAKQYNEKEMNILRRKIKNKGLKTTFKNKPIINYFKEILDLAKSGLPKSEKHYLTIIEKMIEQNVNPKQITINSLNNGKNIKKALEWCILNEII